MGIENNECVVATTWNIAAMKDVESWVEKLNADDRVLFSVLPSLEGGKKTIFMAPDGSKKGWDSAAHGENLRNRLITFLETFDYEDGSNPFYWVEVGYGEFGQKVLRGNGKNVYGDQDYAE